MNYYHNYVRYALDRENGPRAKPLPQISMPTLFIMGLPDVWLDEALPELSKEFVDDLRIEYVPGGTHWIPEGRTDEVNRLIESFL
jgi:pimeloyl-ACP methyl ester carboxylesterase